MIQASSASFAGTAEAVQPVRRIQIAPMSFWTLFAVQAVLLVLLLAALARVAPTFQPLAASADYELVREAVMQRATGATVDPIVEFRPGETAPASSLRGFALNGATYYYQLAGQQNFDPLSRRLVSSNQVRVVLRDTNGPNALIIYTLAR